MPRVLFEKTGPAIWISHLDLMRLFQRSFQRARLPLKHSQGYNPRPQVSVALPLSVGVESVCELLDFDLEGECLSCEEIKARLNAALVTGVRVREVYDSGRKIRDLALLDFEITMEYDRGVSDCAVQQITGLFESHSLTVEKKGKNGPTQQDIIPMLKELKLTREEQILKLRGICCCQNPSLNPMQLVAAIKTYLPELAPDFAICRRLEILDGQGNVFR